MNQQNVSQAIKDAIVAQHAARAIPLRVALWANDRMREGKRDPQLTGTIEVDVLALGEHMAEAIKAGKPKIALYLDVWQNDVVGEDGEALVGKNGGILPMFSGKARNVRVGQVDAAATTEPQTMADVDAQIAEQLAQERVG